MKRIGSVPRHASVLLLLAVAALATVPACTSQAPPPPHAGNPREPIQELLRQRARALSAGDLEGYLAGLGPQAREFEEPIARRALELPLSDIAMTIGHATISDDGTHFTDAQVRLIHRYEELPEDNPFYLHLEYDIERRDTGWVVTHSEFGGGPDVPPAPPWATGPVELARSEHFLAMTRPGFEDIGQALDLAEAARAALVPKLTLETDHKHLALLAQGVQQYTEMGGGESSVALASFVYQTSAAYPVRPEHRHIAVNLEPLLGSPATEVRHEDREELPRSVFQHELAHLALSRFTRPSTAGWVIEGAAVFLAEEPRMDEWRTLVEQEFLDRLSLAAMEDPQELSSEEYAFAYAAVLYLVEHAGEATFFDFYQNFKEFIDLGVPQVRAQGAERLLRRYYRFGIEELDGFTADYIRTAVQR